CFSLMATARAPSSSIWAARSAVCRRGGGPLLAPPATLGPPSPTFGVRAFPPASSATPPQYFDRAPRGGRPPRRSPPPRGAGRGGAGAAARRDVSADQGRGGPGAQRSDVVRIPPASREDGGCRRDGDDTPARLDISRCTAARSGTRPPLLLQHCRLRLEEPAARSHRCGAVLPGSDEGQGGGETGGDSSGENQRPGPSPIGPR